MNSTLLLIMIRYGMGCVYKLLFSSGKSYVGVTSGTLARRMILHKSHAKKFRPGAVYNAIRKYGMPETSVLFSSDSWPDLCVMEVLLIRAYGTLFPGGYNLTTGGEGLPGRVWTDAQRAARSAIMTGKPNPTKGIPRPPLSAAHRDKLSAVLKGRTFSAATRAKIGATKIGNKNCQGRVYTPEMRARASAAQKGRVFTPEHRAATIAARWGNPRV